MAELEAYVAVPNGGTAPRCQARNRAGEQCGQPARKGFAVCSTHGAGTAKREAAGTRKKAGRPVSHGLYSATAPRTLAELRAEVEALGGDLDNTDTELVTIKSILAYLFGRAEWLNEQSTMLEAAVEAVQAVLDTAPVATQGTAGAAELTTVQARQVAEGLAEGRRFLSGISSFTSALIDANLKSITASKLRADTRAKRAEAEAQAHFGELCRVLRGIVHTFAPDDEWLDNFEGALQRELLGPNRIALPDESATP